MVFLFKVPQDTYLVVEIKGDAVREEANEMSIVAEEGREETCEVSGASLSLSLLNDCICLDVLASLSRPNTDSTNQATKLTCATAL